MKKTLLITIIALGLIATLVTAQDTESPLPTMPAGMTGGYETIQSKILKVYSAEDNGAHFRAYVVNWKGKEIVVSDALGRTNKQEGDSITFMAQWIEMPHAEEKMKLLQFMIMDFADTPAKN